MLDHVKWHVPSRIAHTQFSGTLTLNDIQQSTQLAYDLMEREGHSDGVYAIVDITRCEHFDSDIMNLNVLRTNFQTHPHMLWLVAVENSTNPAFRFVALSIIKIMRMKYTLVKTYDEALAFIYHLDPSLPIS